MPIKIRLTLLTPYWREREPELKLRIEALDAVCPTDEPCQVTVGERAEDAMLYMTLTRRRRTMLVSDSSMLRRNQNTTTAATPPMKKAIRHP